MKDSLVRRCLEQLSDTEIEQLLHSSESMCSALRRRLKKPKSARVDAAMFRRWLRTPTASEGLVGELPGLYASEIHGRTDEGQTVERTPGVRALLALDTVGISDGDHFARILTDIRSQPVTTNPDLGCESSVEGEIVAPNQEPVEIATNLDAAYLSNLYDSLEAATEGLTGALAKAGLAVQAGRAVASDLQADIDAWHGLRYEVWEELGVAAPPPHAGLLELAVIRDNVASEEAARQAALDQEARDNELAYCVARLEQFQQTIATLEPLVDGDDIYRGAYDKAVRESIDLKQRVAELAGKLGAEPAPAPTPAPEAEAEPGPGPGPGPESEPAPELEHAPARAADPAPAPPAPTSEPAPAHTPAPTPAPAAEPEPGPGPGPESEPAPEHAPARAAEPEPAPSPASIQPHQPETPAEDRAKATPVSNVNVDSTKDLAHHVRAGGYGAAWLVAQATGMADAAAYRLAAVAFNSGPGGVDPADVLVEFTSAGDTDYHSRQSARVALAASMRAGLAAGWVPRSEVELLSRQANLDERWRALVAAVVTAGDRNYQHLHDFGRQFGPSIDEVRDEGRALQEQLNQQRITFTRANKVLRYLMRSTEPLGSALDAVQASTTGESRREALTAALANLENPDSLIVDADNAMSTNSKRAPIVAHARTTLLKAIDSVREHVSEAVSAAAFAAADTTVALTQEARHELSAAATAVRDDTGDGPGDLALTHLVTWILDPQPPARWPNGELQVLLTESLPITSVRRDDHGLPVITTANASTVISELRSPRPAEELFGLYLERGDLQEAAAVALNNAILLARLDDERIRWSRRLANEVAAVRAEIGRTFADEFTHGDHADAESRLVGPASYSGDRFDLQRQLLDELQGDLRKHREQVAERLRTQVAEDVTDADDQTTIVSLVDSEDFVGASELLALARSGPLPDTRAAADANAGAYVFDSFMTVLSNLDTTGPSSIRDVVAQISEAVGESGEIRGDDLSRLNNWDNLLTKRGHGQRGRQTSMTSVLNALGLDMRGEVSKQPGSTRHFDLYRATGTPVDGSLVPGLGSKTNHYLVAVTGDAKLLKQTLAAAFPPGNGPNIVLFNGVLGADQRRQCLALCRAEKITAIVVDHAVAAYVAARHPRSFRAVQQLTLPFSCFTHYTMVSGQVPDEVFVGRAREQQQVLDPTGSLFVYGGRQLGKSALLRRCENKFNAVEDQHAIYIDLNAHGIGSWSESHQLWNVLYGELVKIGSFGLKPQSNIRNHDPVRRAITSWLDGKDTRRMLLLLDEADAFLEKESVVGPRGFKNIGPLKGLFDSSGGRFKPVFAGLHKVQRLQNVANTPLAHGGRDVLIGPLAAKPAHDLVVKPLEALGYRFANPDAVWRLLAFTNMQPGLIQVVCSDLIDHMQSRPLHKGEPLVTISDDDIDKVTQNPDTREKIAGKLRLTIQLEARYKVIALAVAIESMDAGFRDRYSADDIRVFCEYYWPEGFSDLNSAEFTVYLDELIGLGVLTKDTDGRYSVRSPNIVTMLGSRDELETSLKEAEFELEPEYNPRSTRRQEEIDGSPVRSPLSEHDLAEMVPMRDRHDPINFVVVGSDALGVVDVAPILHAVGHKRHVHVITTDHADIREALTEFKFVSGGGGKRATLLVIDASRANAEEAHSVADTVKSMRKRPQGHLIIIYGASGIDAAASHLQVQAVIPTMIISLHKWSGDGIRSWHDNPFLTPADRRELLDHSGGWPDLVAQAVTGVANRGDSHGEMWKKLSAFPATSEEANTFLTRAGVGDCTRPLLGQWAEFGLTDYEPIVDIAAVLERDLDDMRAIVTDLRLLGVVNERNDQYLLDPVVSRALSALA